MKHIRTLFPEEKITVFDNIMVQTLGKEFRYKWLSEDKQYKIYDDGVLLWLVVWKPDGIIYRSPFAPETLTRYLLSHEK